MNYKVFFRESLNNNIPINIIVNLILLIENQRKAFQIEPEIFDDQKQVDHFLSIIENYDIKSIIYRGNDILNGFSIFVLNKNVHLFDINKILNKDHFYIGDILGIENNNLNYRDFFLEKSIDKQPFQVRIIAAYSDKSWDDFEYSQELLAEFNMPDFIRGCIFCFLTHDYHLPSTFELIKNFQKFFFNLEIPIRIHLELDPQPNYWNKYDIENDKHKPFF